MGKLYHTDEVKEVFDKKLNDMIMAAANDETLSGDVLAKVIERIRDYRTFTEGVISYMEQEDIAYEAEMAKWRAKKEARENAADS